MCGSWFVPSQREEIGDETDDDVAQADEGYQSFKNLAGDDGELDAYEIKEILNQVFQQGQGHAAYRNIFHVLMLLNKYTCILMWHGILQSSHRFYVCNMLL